MPDEITLDKEVFKALAGETRIAVMKSLRERRKTQSELAKGIGIAAPTVKEHIDILARAGLVREIDDGHKWKYIELTVKGKSLLEPQDKRILVLLGTSLVGAVGAGVLAYSQLQHFAAASAANSFSFVQGSAGIASDAMAKNAAPLADTLAVDAGSRVVDATAKASAAIIPPAVESASALVSPAAADAAQVAIQSIPQIPFFELGLMLVCLLVFGISVGMWIKQSYY
ncbi:MAG: winged helix-turn-helix transcriptional regulator [Candidatus Iainarchaeum archaeon]|uniref:Winged helix-turn-helix transcriptional regulator n=1 Tax=Candidatus Iainarchaeum sp. TaxID=3101447 RepID=A0A7T9I1H1_9ARCH|nr:MAG: winged helix-turn-helix transcriptional regulator [Candidatus Diapherotrites archaeon]